MLTNKVKSYAAEKHVNFYLYIKLKYVDAHKKRSPVPGNLMFIFFQIFIFIICGYDFLPTSFNFLMTFSIFSFCFSISILLSS